jgi:ABC-type transporter MlaC component
MLRRLLVAILCCLPALALAKSPMDTLTSAQSKLESTLESAPEKGSAEAKKRRSTLEAEAKKLFDFETLGDRNRRATSRVRGYVLILSPR